ncbi:4Fe-4S dicluster domain-containing protein, partial [Elusimicrobiota bacterium]
YYSFFYIYTSRLMQYSVNTKINWDIMPVWGGVKEFVFPARNTVSGPVENPEKINIVTGLRNCDIKALTGVLDKIFLQEQPEDTIYKSLRNNLRIVTVDCINPAESCFCTSVGGQPYGSLDSDLNITVLGDIILLDIGTEEGKELLEKDNLQESMNYVNADQEEEKKRKDLRDTAERKVNNNFTLDFKENGFQEKIVSNRLREYWSQKASKCMQCGGCNFCCPTCYCNVLNEVSNKSQIRKVIQWDSCQFPGYARVAGGANQRPEMWERFRHRYSCKFTKMPLECGVPGCTGCGRCIQTCPAGIDIKETIIGLYD